ncbi:iron-containing alcohol dehydrogenase [uncultured Ilyobacter sp.]|uniref:iron-containing alcohol dehydrogenase n=1 Tax=uncultured Ilyobacter sp. TaxID=544433 RepID=UPI0029C0F1E8|nr:iron-containing alcohol dehydrogenase [uncultured Ilyobacter sp.]
MKNFNFSNTPKLYFGEGTFDKIKDIILSYGNRVLLITGGSSFEKSIYNRNLLSDLEKSNIKYYKENVKNEPSPKIVDEISKKYRKDNISVVLAVGGGSVMDTGKAVSAMLTKLDSVKEYLEGIGEKQHDGNKIPFIAVPTTSGTGSEATKNAVISEVGSNGFKKSLRHDNFVPNCAVIDPRLTASCPKSVTAASGMDAFSQLIEAYLSCDASPMTDSLALSGLENIKDGLIESYENGENLDARGKVAYASYLSGVVLANAGLGTVHGFASPIGGYFDIPHGVVCGTLIGELIRINIKKLSTDSKKNTVYLEKYAEVGRIFSGKKTLKREAACEALVDEVKRLTEVMKIPKLGRYGITEQDLDKIIEKTGNKNNPVKLTKEELKEMLINRL